MKYRHLSILAAVGTIGLAACGSHSSSLGSSASVTTMNSNGTALSSPNTKFNTADVAFAQGMVPHHQQAVEMADIALDPMVGASDQVRKLATGIKGAQDPEIKMMTDWLTTWGQPMQMDTSMTQTMSPTQGMMSTQEMDSLHAVKGAAFDTMWLEMMIRHHKGAISSAQTVKASGSNSDVLTLADQIIAGQQAEISVMQALLAK